MKKLNRILDEFEFNEAKEAQAADVNTADCAREIECSLVETNRAFKSSSYEEYKESFEEENKKTHAKQIADIAAGDEHLKPYDNGFLRGLLTTKTELSLNVKGKELASQIITLRKQIDAAWDMVHLLERRKNMLEQQISSMESYLRSGVGLAEDHLEG